MKHASCTNQEIKEILVRSMLGFFQCRLIDATSTITTQFLFQLKSAEWCEVVLSFRLWSGHRGAAWLANFLCRNFFWGQIFKLSKKMWSCVHRRVCSSSTWKSVTGSNRSWVVVWLQMCLHCYEIGNEICKSWVIELILLRWSLESKNLSSNVFMPQQSSGGPIFKPTQKGGTLRENGLVNKA